jgi:hypothetical protein
MIFALTSPPPNDEQTLTATIMPTRWDAKPESAKSHSGAVSCRVPRSLCPDPAFSNLEKVCM